ncbi:MAG: P-II family nitrogen regulator [Gemmatimonadales bacterium]
MMKLIKAIVRLELLEELVKALKTAGAPRLAVNHVCTVGSGVDPEKVKFSMELGTGYTEKALVQFACPAAEVNRFVAVILEHAHTGRHGDGVILVSEVEQAIKIRTGVVGAEALS